MGVGYLVFSNCVLPHFPLLSINWSFQQGLEFKAVFLQLTQSANYNVSFYGLKLMMVSIVSRNSLIRGAATFKK